MHISSIKQERRISGQLRGWAIELIIAGTMSLNVSNVSSEPIAAKVGLSVVTGLVDKALE